MTATIPNVDVPNVNPICPDSTLNLLADVETFIDDATYRLTFGNWLRERAISVCGINHNTLHALIDANKITRDAA